MITVIRNNTTYRIQFVEHMVHHANLESVLSNGLLSHNQAHQRGLIRNDISMQEVQSRRASKNITLNNTNYNLHNFVPFYFTAKNPMLYRRRNIQHELVIIFVDPALIGNATSLFTDGNAASNATKFYSGIGLLQMVPFEVIFGRSWNHENEAIKRENVRKMCAEVLAYEAVGINLFRRIACPTQGVFNYVQNAVRRIGRTASHIEVVLAPGDFFL